MNKDTIIHHYPGDLMKLLVDTIPKLVKGKDEVLLFFKGAGVDDADLRSLRNRVKRERATKPEQPISKYEIARTILTTINDRGEQPAAIRTRREIVKRVCEWANFEGSYPNDRLVAQGLVAKVRELVNEKDAFTRMQRAKDAEAAKNAADYERRMAERRAREEEADALYKELRDLFTITDPWKRGKALEGVMNRLFKHAGISIREAFTVRSREGHHQVFEQVDGMIMLDGVYVLVELKWEAETLGRDQVANHCMRVMSRGGARGLLVSHLPVSDAAVEMCREHMNRALFGFCELRDIVMLAEKKANLGVTVRRWTSGRAV